MAGVTAASGRCAVHAVTRQWASTARTFQTGVTHVEWQGSVAPVPVSISLAGPTPWPVGASPRFPGVAATRSQVLGFIDPRVSGKGVCGSSGRFQAFAPGDTDFWASRVADPALIQVLGCRVLG